MSEERNRIDDMLIRGIDKVEQKLDKLDNKIEHTHSELVKHLAEDEVTQRTLSETLIKMNSILDRNTESLIEHIEGVRTLKQLHLDNVTRIEQTNSRLSRLEEPVKVRQTIKNWIITGAKVAGAIVTIGGAVAWFMGLF